jgi:hypothetical protein
MPNEQQAITALTIAGSVTFGLVLALLGHLKLTLARRPPDQATRRIDRLLFLLNLALIPLMLLAGLLVDFWGPRPTIITGSILLALAFLSLSAGAAYKRTLVAVVVAAFAASAVGVSSLVLMPQGLFGLQQTTASLQYGLVLVALGGLLMPPLVDLLVRAIGFGRTMAVVAFLTLVPAFLSALAPIEKPQAHLSELLPLLQSPSMWMAGIVFFCYAPLEGFISVWTTALLASSGQPQRQVRWLTGFWSAFLVSRLVVAWIEHAGYLGDKWSGWFLVGTALLSVVALGNLAGATRALHAGKGLVILGVFLGPLFPLLVGMVFRLDHAHELPGTAFGLLYACGSVGGLALAPLVGLSARAQNIMIALRVPLFIALIMASATLLFVLAPLIKG